MVVVAYWAFMEYIFISLRRAFPPSEEKEMVEYGFSGNTRLVITNLPSFPNISMLDRSIKMRMDIMPSFSKVGAMVVAVKFSLKSTMPLFVRSKEKVCFWGLYFIGTSSPELFARVIVISSAFRLSMSKTISQMPLLALGSGKERCFLPMFDLLILEDMAPRRFRVSGDGWQEAYICPSAARKRLISRGRVLALRN